MPRKITAIFPKLIDFGLFRRANFYGMPHLHFFRFEKEICTRNVVVRLLSNATHGTQF